MSFNNPKHTQSSFEILQSCGKSLNFRNIGLKAHTITVDKIHKGKDSKYGPNHIITESNKDAVKRLLNKVFAPHSTVTIVRASAIEHGKTGNKPDKVEVNPTAYISCDGSIEQFKRFAIIFAIDICTAIVTIVIANAVGRHSGIK